MGAMPALTASPALLIAATEARARLHAACLRWVVRPSWTIAQEGRTAESPSPGSVSSTRIAPLAHDLLILLADETDHGSSSGCPGQTSGYRRWWIRLFSKQIRSYCFWIGAPVRSGDRAPDAHGHMSDFPATLFAAPETAAELLKRFNKKALM